MLKKYALLLLLLGLLTLLGSCGLYDLPPSQQNPNYPVFAEPSANITALPEPTPTPSPQSDAFSLNYDSSASLNPLMSPSQTNLTLTGLMFEGLFRVLPDYSFEPVLCYKWNTDDGGYTFTFDISSGIKAHDGTDLDIFDVIHSINTARSAGRFSARLAAISDVYQNEGSLIITLSKANMNLPMLLDIPIVKDGTAYDDIPVGTGPYSFRNSNNNPSLSAFIQHRDYPNLPIDTFLLKEIPNNEISAAIETGQLDLVLTNRSEQGYVEAASYGRWFIETTELHYLGFNSSRGFCASAYRRLIISSIIDRDYISSALMEDTSPVVLPVPPSSPLYFNDIADTARIRPEFLSEFMTRNHVEIYDKAAAKLQYMESGHILSFTLDFIVNKDNLKKLTAARYITNQLEQAGFDITLRELSWEQYLNALENGDFDIYYGEIRLTPDLDLSPLLSSSGNVNYGIYDSYYDTLTSAYNQAPPDSQEERARDLLRYFSDNSPLAPLLFEKQVVYTQWGRISGMTPTPWNIFNNISNWET